MGHGELERQFGASYHLGDSRGGGARGHITFNVPDVIGHTSVRCQGK
jgi:hypothetical protein